MPATMDGSAPSAQPPQLAAQTYLDPIVTLATGLHGQPGVYALLVGSGVSTAAGIPTGWGVVTELVRRAAVAADPEDPDASSRAAADPEGWWAEHGDGEPLGYSNLLAALAPTQAARRDLLAGFFEPTAEELQEGAKTPGLAHRKIADLVKRGLVRVLLTTNFDRLLERALEDAGVPPQVIARPEAIAGMTPLAHARATVVKLHGDYADLQSRNTVEELSEYPPEWRTLLTQVTSEYGLVISGWSADWDVALVRALQEVSSRRYPLYWDSRSSKGEAARRLIAQHAGRVVVAASADDLFGKVSASVDALDRLSSPPLTAAMAVARVKRYLPDPLRRIDLHDLIMSQVEEVVEKAAAQTISIPGLSHERMEEILEERRADAEGLCRMLATGVFHDRGGEHSQLWVASVQRLMQARTSFEGSFDPRLEEARHYPALLALRAMGIAAVRASHESTIVKLLTEPLYKDRMRNGARIPAVHALHDLRVLDPEVINGLPRWYGNRWLYPMSDLVRDDLRDTLRDLIPDDDDYARAFDGYEFRSALALFTSQHVPGAYKAVAGEYLGEWQWRDGKPNAEHEFEAALGVSADDTPWWPVMGGRDGYRSVLDNLRGVLAELQRWG